MKDWQALTIGVSETIGPMRARMKESQRLGSADLTVVDKWLDDLKTQQAAVERIKTDYERGRLRIHVAGVEESTFQWLTQNLSEHTADIKVARTDLRPADVRKFYKYLQVFLAAGPHGPGKPPPGEDEDVAEGAGPHGPGMGEPGDE